jgi:hypothetical protein
VAIQDKDSKKWSKFGTIIDQPRKRSYHVKLDSGAVMWRNRRFLKPVPTPSHNDDNQTSTTATAIPQTTGQPGPCCPVERTPSSTPAPASKDASTTDPAPRRTSTRNRRKPVRFGFDD